MLTRKQFLRSALQISAGALGLTVLHACGTSLPMPMPPAPDAHGATPPPGATPDGAVVQGRCISDGTAVTIADNHGHIMMVTKDEIVAAAAKTYHIQGTSDHDHTVMLAASDFQQLAQDMAIMTTSSTDAGHNHAILVACA